MTSISVEQSIDQFRDRFVRITQEVGRRIVGHEEVVNLTVTSLLAGGHVLLEGIPGVGKTSLVHTLADVLHLKFSRIQFTPDLMPADIVGTNIVQEQPHGGTFFEFQPGPIFANVVLADEINRATPKTQSALLEAMQDVSVSVGKTTCTGSSRADWVFGVARLISSASTTFAKIGPGWNTNSGPPWGCSWTMFVPTISAGIRSGVNWMRENLRCRTSASVWTRLVLPTPGMPSSSTCPPARRLVTVRLITSS